MVSFVEIATVLALLAIGATFFVKGWNKPMKKKVVVGGDWHGYLRWCPQSRAR